MLSKLNILLLASNAVLLLVKQSIRRDKSINHHDLNKLQFAPFSNKLDRQNIGADHIGLCDAFNTDKPVSAVDACIEVIIALVPCNENKIRFVPRMIYNNADTMKLYILKDNKGKAGIYPWIHVDSGKSYVASPIDLKERIAKYFSVNFMLKELEDSESLIYRALLKYGYSAFRLDIIEYCDISNLTERNSTL